MYLNVLKFFLCLVYTSVTYAKCPATVKYAVQTFKSKEEFQGPTISPNVDAYIIWLEENVTTICKGMLNITLQSYHFYGYNKNIQEIEPGAFQNQNLRNQLFLSNNALSVIKRGTFKNMFITELDLSYNKITVIEEGGVENLPNLSIIHLSRNQIHEFHPTSIINTPKLTFFDMSINKMKKFDDRAFRFMNKERNVAIGFASNEVEEISPKIFEGIDVFALNISDNKLKSIPREIFAEQKLQSLGIAVNQLTHLDDAFFKMDTVRLRCVELDGNNFDDETTKKLEPFMAIIMENIRLDQNYHQ